MLDFLGPRFKGPVVIAESSAGNPRGLRQLPLRRGHQGAQAAGISLVDLNEEAKYVTHQILNGDLHFVPARLAARLLDPDAFIICSAMLKTHNTAVATLSIKNMALGPPLHNPRAETTWNINGSTTAECARRARYRADGPKAPTILARDGDRRLRGDGGQRAERWHPVPSRIAIASTDYVAADRVGIETMGIDASWLGYFGFAARPAWARTTGEDRGPRAEACGGDEEVQDERQHPGRCGGWDR